MGNIFLLGDRGSSASKMTETTFAEIGWKEPNEIEDIAANNLSIFTPQGQEEESLLLVGRQVVDETKGRNDLVALDSEGNLVLIELKRDREDIRAAGGKIELQAIRYASALAKIESRKDLLERIYVPYIDDNEEVEEPFDHARSQLDEFLRSNEIEPEDLNRRQRIILFSSGYDDRSLSSLAWLSKNGVDVTVLRGDLYKHQGQTMMSVEQLLPVSQEEEYFVDILEKSSSPKNEGSGTLKVRDLIKEGLVSEGDKVHIKGDKKEQAVLVDHQHVEVDGEKRRRNDWAQDVKDYASINFYNHVVHVKTGKLFDELREQISE